MRYYGKWSADEKGVPEDTTKCIVEIHDGYLGIGRQCKFNRRYANRMLGFGDEKLFCKRHSVGLLGLNISVPKNE